MKEVLAQELQNYMHSLLPEPKAWQTEISAVGENKQKQTYFRNRHGDRALGYRNGRAVRC